MPALLRLSNRSNGFYTSRAHNIWNGLCQRCTNPKSKDYPRYGGRGITVDPRWRESFLAFVEDMGFPPEGKSIDRIDNNGPYTKANCRWATAKEQASNRREYPNPHLVGMNDPQYRDRWYSANVLAKKKNSASQYLGVSFDQAKEKWAAKITVNKRTVNLGRFDNEEDAARAFDRAAILYRGHDARLNFPEDRANAFAVTA